MIDDNLNVSFQTSKNEQGEIEANGFTRRDLMKTYGGK